MIIVGKTGVHADDDLDIGGTSENLLRQVSCHVWLTQTSYIPPFEVVAEETVTWSVEAEKKLSRAPEFVRDMARRMVLRHAQKLGHTFITSDVVDEVMKSMMPGFGDDASKAARDRTVAWSDDASKLIDDIQDKAVADNIRLRAVKRARRDQADEVGVRHVTPFLDLVDATALTWSAAALARVARVPEMVRDTVKLEIEDLARQREQDPVSLELAEEVILEVRKNMCPVPEQGADGG
jgi:hypothetical protein